MEPEPDRPDFWPRPDGLHFILLRPDGLRGGFIEHITRTTKDNKGQQSVTIFFKLIVLILVEKESYLNGKYLVLNYF